MNKEEGFYWLSLGGVGEIGKNCYVLDIQGKLIVIDVGMSFPDLRMFGVDIVIPDFSYLVKQQHRIKAIVLTHGHEDHIGSLSYLLQDLRKPPPIYGTKFTLALLRSKLAEFGLGDTPLTEYKPGDDFEIDGIKIHSLRVTHSIPDNCSLAFETPAGIYLHSGDVKLDPTPVDGKTTDLDKLARIGEMGVLAMTVDITNIESTGHSGSESSVRPNLHRYVSEHQGRVFVTCFASNIHRVQQVIDVAVQAERKVLVLGRTMVDNVQLSQDIGYLKVPPNVLVDPYAADGIKPDRLLVVLTGSQGEPLAAMARLANGEHRFLTVQEDDLFLFSARPIPGNETAIYGVIDDLFRLGAEVVYGLDTGVHVSGHGYQEEIRQYMQIASPRFVIPHHGHYRRQMRLKKIAAHWGIEESNIAIASLGERWHISRKGIVLEDVVKSGEVFIAAAGGVDLSRRVINERLALAEDGVLIFSVVMSADGSEVVSGPEIISKGLVPQSQAPDLLTDIEDAVRDAVHKNRQRGPEFALQLRNNLQNTIQRIIFQKTRINPVVMGVLSYVQGAEGDGEEPVSRGRASAAT